MAIVDIPERLRNSNIPEYVNRMTLPKLGYPALREVIKNEEFRNGEVYRLFTLWASASASDVAVMSAVFAKEIILANVPCVYQPLVGLHRELSLLDYSAMDTKPLSDVLQRIGKGYVVIPDFEKSEHLTSEVCDWLFEHASRGGGLVLASSEHIANVPHAAMVALLHNSFTQLTAVRANV